MNPEPPDYYDQFGPIERRARRLYNTVSGIWAKKLVVLAETKWRLGDEIMAIPVYEAMSKQLHAAHDDVHFVAWCNYPELLECNPYIDAVNVQDVRPNLYRKLRGAPRDQNRAEFYEHHFDLGQSMTSPRLYFESWDTPLWNEVPVEDAPVVALCLGASWETKRWSTENWNALAEKLEASGCRVIVLGQKGEEIGAGTSFVARTGIRDAACLLHQADLTISNDSGLMHLSLAAGTQTLGLFGPTASDILIQDNPDFYPLTNERDCQGCWNRDLSISEPGSCPKNIDVCMETISVDEVVTRALEIVAVEEI